MIINSPNPIRAFLNRIIFSISDMMLKTSYKKKHDSDYTNYKTDELMDHGKTNTLTKSRYIKISYTKQQVALIPLLESSDKKT